MAERARLSLAVARAGRLAWVLPAVVAVAVAGCGQTRPHARTSPPMRPGTSPDGRGLAACPSQVAAAQLSAIRFFTSRTGVGVWARDPRCGARLAVTSNGGRTWRVTAGRLPGPAGYFTSTPALDFASPLLGWANGGGVLDLTRDGGTTWSRVRLGGPVQAISLSGTSLWAFVSSCPAITPDLRTCRYHLETAMLPGRSWADAGLLPAALGGYTPIAVAGLTPRRALLALGQMSSLPAYVTTDGGASWTPVRACGRYSPNAVAATSPSVAWILCLGGVAAGSSAKSLARTSDGGQHWQIMAEDPSLMPGAPRPFPVDPGGALAAPSPSVLWFAGVNALWGSTNAGRTWHRAPAASTGGAGGLASFSFVSPSRGWLLIPGTGLWQTTDGQHWRPVRR
jgi:photosystem II stability/assembly factor-like uncharacterized protein